MLSVLDMVNDNNENRMHNESTMTMKEKQIENHGKIAGHMISLFKIIPNKYQSTFAFTPPLPWKRTFYAFQYSNFGIYVYVLESVDLSKNNRGLSVFISHFDEARMQSKAIE